VEHISGIPYVYNCTYFFYGIHAGHYIWKGETIMSGWEIFTWISVIILGLGSIIVFILFLKDVPELLKKSEKESL
jgi:DMSO/TMAO reductase YedYZ heme-binding membrane subunit